MGLFDHLIRELRGMHGTISIPTSVELDENGYMDRACPSDECGEHFKVHFEDWKSLLSDQCTWCPRCGHIESSVAWNTKEQRGQHIGEARRYVRERVARAVQHDARRVNSRASGRGLLTMRMSYRPGRPELVVPAQASDVMTQEFRCEHCQCRYASVGAAFFCPGCGRNSILENFATSLETTKLTVESIPVLRQMMGNLSGPDAAADMVRHLLEEGLCKVVACFQKYAEVSFAEWPDAGAFRVRPNLFQSLSESDRLWRSATTVGYKDILTDAEYQRLVTYFQQRHVLEHQDGFVDQVYIDRSLDRRFNVGQRLVVTEDSVLNLVAIIEKLAHGIGSVRGGSRKSHLT